MGEKTIITHSLTGIQDFETYLNRTFQQVTPNPEFITRLDEQIKINPPRIAGVQSALKMYVILVVGCCSGLIVFWMIKRLISHKT